MSSFALPAQCTCPHAITLGLKQREEEVPSHPALAAEVTRGCPLPLGMVMEVVTVHSCVLSFQLVRSHCASPAPTEYLGSFRPTPSGLLKLPLDTSS